LPVTAFSFRVQAPLFEFAQFRLIGTSVADRAYLDAQGASCA
jgi:hypothetical protein